MLESERVFSAVLALLKTDTTLTNQLPAGALSIHRALAPQGTATPYVVVTPISGADLNALGGYRAYTRTLIQVTVWGYGPQSWLVIRTVADRIDFLLQRYSGSFGGVEFDRIVREFVPYVEPDNVNGVIYPRMDMQYAANAAA